MALLKNKMVVEGDAWTLVPDDAAIPASGDVIVGAARFTTDADALANRQGKLGIRVDPDTDVNDVVPSLSRVALVAIHFPKFSDGRAYSAARLLRERHGYAGEMRAVGEVLADQLQYMARCGIDSFQLVSGKDVDAALRALDDFTVAYQGATDEPRPLYRRAKRGHAAS